MNMYEPDAKALVEGYLKDREEIARINTEADAAEAGVRAQMKAVDEEMYRRKRELEDEQSRRYMVLNNCLASVQSTRKHNLEPLHERMNRVERIIALLRIAETIQPVKDIEDGEVTQYDRNHSKYFEWLGYLYNDEYLKIRLLIAENKKPKNCYSLIAYGRDAFNDKTLLSNQGVYSYGIDLADHGSYHTVRVELGSFPSVADAKKYAERPANKIMKQFLADYGALKADYLSVTAMYKLSYFEQITAEDKQEGSN